MRICKWCKCVWVIISVRILACIFVCDVQMYAEEIAGCKRLSATRQRCRVSLKCFLHTAWRDWLLRFRCQEVSGAAAAQTQKAPGQQPLELLAHNMQTRCSHSGNSCKHRNKPQQRLRQRTMRRQDSATPQHLHKHIHTKICKTLQPSSDICMSTTSCESFGSCEVQYQVMPWQWRRRPSHYKTHHWLTMIFPSSTLLDSGQQAIRTIRT